MLVLDRVGDLLPLHPERRVGEQVVEPLVRVLVALIVRVVLLEGVADLEFDAFWPFSIMSDRQIAYDSEFSSWPKTVRVACGL
ncbi:MAG: hypothetical protein QNJ12_00060 [Ilumatobacter sp.]|nr:hypothetical protein [Ilumatobacter sp.]MDJ0767144.1 hypothetical protein [Ilumatobacter sp.]